RCPAGADPRTVVGRGADRGRAAGTRPARRRRTVLGADGGNRPVRRIFGGLQMAPACVDVAGPAWQAESDRQPRTRRQTLCGAVGFAVLDGGATGPATAAR